MFPRIKMSLLSGIATLAVMIGVLAIEPACIFYIYQPEVPEHLKGE